MKLISWNVNGIRACLGKGFSDFFKQIDADIFCLQETKCQPGQVELEFEKFYMVTIYTPNAKRELERLDYRMIWEDEVRKYLLKLKIFIN